MTSGTRIHSYFTHNGANPGRFVLLACAFLCFSAVYCDAAQQAGPLKQPPPPPATAKPAAKSSADSAAAPANQKPPAASLAIPQELPPPTLSVDEMIHKIADREAYFKEARGNYTYTQSIMIKDFGPSGEEGGEYRLTSDIVFTPEGKRFENVTSAPPPSLQFIELTPEDMADFKDIQPFLLTPEELPKYDIKYVAHEPVDQLTTYVFEVTPKQIVKGKTYFQGRIWVDDKDFSIVKTDGKAMHGLKVKKGQDTQQFARFVTYRENVAADLWFPTYTHSDDILHFKAADLRIIITVKYQNYKYFGSKIKIGPAKPDKQ